MGVSDLDLIQERFEGLGTRAVVSDFTVSHRQAPVAPVITPRPAPSPETGRYPCFLVRPATEAVAPGADVSAQIAECIPDMHADREADELEVDLRYGALVTRKTDLFVADSIPLALTRSYRVWDHRPRAFGLGTNHPYDTFPVGSRQPYTFIDVFLADGSPIHFDRISQGTGYADAVYEHTATSTRFFKSRFQWNGNGWDLRLEDGTVYLFPEAYAATRSAEGAMIGMRDAQQRALHFERDRRRNLVKLTSPAGRALTFEYDSGDRVIRASDDRRHVVRYTYDAGGRLAAVTDSTERVVRYLYDRSYLVGAQDAQGHALFDVRYTKGRVGRLRLADGREFGFTFVFLPDQPNKAVQATVTAPDGSATRIDMSGATAKGPAAEAPSR